MNPGFVAMSQEVTSMRIKGAGQFGAQFGGQIYLGLFFLFVWQPVTPAIVTVSSKACRPLTLPCPTPYCLCIFYYFTGVTIVLLRPMSIQLPLPNKPSGSLSTTSTAAACRLSLLLSSPLSPASPALLSHAAYHTHYAQLNLEFPLCQQSGTQFFYGNQSFGRQSFGRQSVLMRCIPYYTIHTMPNLIWNSRFFNKARSFSI